jgi:hypothetical protein
MLPKRATSSTIRLGNEEVKDKNHLSPLHPAEFSHLGTHLFVKAAEKVHTEGRAWKGKGEVLGSGAGKLGKRAAGAAACSERKKKQSAHGKNEEARSGALAAAMQRSEQIPVSIKCPDIYITRSDCIKSDHHNKQVTCTTFTRVHACELTILIRSRRDQEEKAPRAPSAKLRVLNSML